MTFLHTARILARRLGLEVQRYNLSSSPGLRTKTLLDFHNVDLIIDVGANNGGFATELRSSGYSGQILSFEPSQKAHAELKEAAALDPQWIIAERMALGEKEHEAILNIAGNSTSSSLLDMLNIHLDAAPDSAYVSQESCQVRRLDQVSLPILEISRRIFLKIDTQGYEKSVYEGATGLGERLVGLQCEMSLTNLYEGQALFDELHNLFAADGFELWNLAPGFIDRKTGRLLQFDATFFRRNLGQSVEC